ncbi:hypothetical protein P9112_000423 [Eukaryota sp. TZLM1-RC]
MSSPSQAPQTPEELTTFVQSLLQQMQSRFETMSDTILKRIDEMGTRIDELEGGVTQLLEDAGVSSEKRES